jgi:hypothetical protein
MCLFPDMDERWDGIAHRGHEAEAGGPAVVMAPGSIVAAGAGSETDRGRERALLAALDRLRGKWGEGSIAAGRVMLRTEDPRSEAA